MREFPLFAHAAAERLLGLLRLEQVPALAVLAASENWFTDQLFTRRNGAGPATVLTAATAPGCELPIPERGLDLLVSAYYLNTVPKRELYMALAEARRVLKPGGQLALLSPLPAEGWLAGWRRRLGLEPKDHPPWEPMHFVSPEDWLTELEEVHPHPGGRSKLVLLRRTE